MAHLLPTQTTNQITVLKNDVKVSKHKGGKCHTKTQRRKGKLDWAFFFYKSLQVSALKIKRKITEQKKNKCEEGHACVCRAHAHWPCCEGMVSSEQDGVVVWVLYPLEQWRESRLVRGASELSPPPRVRPSCSLADCGYGQEREPIRDQKCEVDHNNSSRIKRCIKCAFSLGKENLCTFSASFLHSKERVPCQTWTVSWLSPHIRCKLCVVGAWRSRSLCQESSGLDPRQG